MILKPSKDTENYLLQDYGLIEHTTLLTDHEDIYEFFCDNTELLGNILDGYDKSKAFIAKIGDLFYRVYVQADVVCSEDNYWYCDVTKVEYTLIRKPLPLERKRYVLQVTATESYITYLKKITQDKGFGIDFIE